MEKIDDVFAGVEKTFKEYNSMNSCNIFEDAKLYKALSAEVVSGFTDILKSAPKMPNSKIVDRVFEFLT